jgi:hypothetical protein
MRVVKRYAEAFKEGYNLVGLASAVAVSAALLNPLPLLGALVAEAAYLLFVPDSAWYDRRLEAKYDAEIIARREKLKKEILPCLRYEVRDRFTLLEDKRRQIEAQSKAEDKWFREALRKLDYLLEKYLQFAQQESRFSQYLVSLEGELRSGTPVKTPPPVVSKGKRPRFDVVPQADGGSAAYVVPTQEWVENTVDYIQSCYQGEIDNIDKHLAEDPDFPTSKVEEKRKDILGRRKEYVGRIGMILHNLGGQMQLMQDTFGLINDEIRARSPEQVLADIDEVVTASNSLAEAIDSVAPLEELVAKL